MITNENLEILFRFRCRHGEASKLPPMFVRFCFRNNHVGHAQATTAGHTYETISNPSNLVFFFFFFFAFAFVIQQREHPKSWHFGILFTRTVRPEMITQIIRKLFFCVTDVCAIGKLMPDN